MNILLTGGTGYIGSHTAAVLAAAGHRVVLYDNLSNSHASVVQQLQTVTSLHLPFIKGDIRDTDLLEQAMRKHAVDTVIHCAGLKSVGESVLKPLDYYDNNVVGTVSLLTAMQSCAVRRLVFSSSATVYGHPQYLPIDERHPTSATNPYGRTKLHIEHMLADLAQSAVDWKIICLRYFNPVGAHPSGLMAENPLGTPNNLMPYIVKVAKGELPHLPVFGNDYPTSDGTGVRDYIHVMDLAEGHLAAVHAMERRAQIPFDVFNLGTGKGYSVLEMIKTYEQTNGCEIPHVFMPRRSGDVAECFARTDKAEKILGWRATRGLSDMCRS